MTGRILIVDDNRDNLYLLENLLKAHRFDVISSKNGKDALEKARLNPPDLIISDILMPVMDGYTLCMECKSNDTLKPIPFVFYTATYTEPKDEAFALSLGAERFLIKPQEPSALIKIIKEILEGNRTVKQAGSKPLGEEMEFFRQHNEILFKKIEKKMQDLETTNRQLRQLEEELRASEAHIKSISNNIPNGMIYQVVTQPDGTRKFTYASDSVKTLYGISPEEAMADAAKIYGRVHEDDIDMLRQTEDEALKTLSTFQTDIRVKDPSGGIRWSSLTSTPALLENGSVCWNGIEIVITERKRNEEKQKETGEKFKFLAENMNDILWIMDLDLKTVYVTPSIEAVLGFTPEERIRQSVQEQLTPHSLSIAMETLTREQILEKHGQSELDRKVKLVLEYYHKDGTTRWLESIVTAIRDEHSVLTNLYGVSRDVTETKQAGEKLRDSEERYRRASSIISDVVYSCKADEEGNFSIDWMTGAADEISGYSIEEMMSQKCWRFLVVEEDLPIFEEKVVGLAPGTQGTCELRIRRKDGKILWIVSRAECVVKPEDPDCLYLYGGLSNINLRKKAEKDLIERVKELRCLYSIADLIENSNSLQDLFQNVVNQLPPGFLYPEHACARITFKNQEFKTDNFQETEWKISSKIILHEKPLGAVDVCYPTTMPPSEEGLFLEEERILIKAVAERLGRVVERKQFEEEREKLITELQKAMSEVKILSGLLPICSSCKKIRDDQGYWNQIESYIKEHSEAEFSHGICPECAKRLYSEFLKEK
jgi:PAS domain S-box-containing protein